MYRAAENLRDVILHDHAVVQENFRDAVLAGLSQSCKAIPCRFLYDAAGSALFERICETPEYYLTRTEMSVLQAHSRDMAELIGPDCQLIELGSGASRKVQILLNALERPRAYIPVDISREHLRLAAAALARAYPRLEVAAVCGDYTQDFALPDIPFAGRRVGFFPGSTIGNLAPRDAIGLLSLWAKRLGSGAAMLIGVDLKKDALVLDAAYNDASGVTRAFIKNILTRANRELDANFVANQFVYEARYVAERGRVEIFLRSDTDQTVRVAGRRFEFAADERVHIEYSYKYEIEEFQALARAAEFTPAAVWTDPARMFSVHYLTT